MPGLPYEEYPDVVLRSVEALDGFVGVLESEEGTWTTQNINLYMRLCRPDLVALSYSVPTEAGSLLTAVCLGQAHLTAVEYALLIKSAGLLELATYDSMHPGDGNWSATYNTKLVQYRDRTLELQHKRHIDSCIQGKSL
jgi:hypothetical protein